MKLNPIHQKPEERQAANSDQMLEAIRSLPKNDLQSLTSKLDEVKSASLITNRLLKGVSKLEIKGDPGEPGRDGKDGRDGSNGKIGPQGLRGNDGRDGRDGKDGMSVVGPSGKDGKNGLDGSPDLPDQIIEKIHSSKLLIDHRKISGLREAMSTLDQIGKNPAGKLQNVGGGPSLIMRDSTGVSLGAYVTDLQFGAGMTPAYSSGKVTLTSTATLTLFTETPGGLVDGANKAYTTAHTINNLLTLAINGQFIHPSEYTISGAGFTMGTALPAALTGTSFTIVYL